MIELESSRSSELSGIVGVAARIIDALGEVGVGVLSFLETVFPPIPSEVILPLAGFLSNLGEMSVVWVLVSATLGAYLGALLFYSLGHRLGEERVIRVLSKLPLVDRPDFERATNWFNRHGGRAVFFGRLLPGVRSLISLPAGAAHMPLKKFTLLTLAGTMLWNGLLIGLGYSLGTQYALIDEYSQWLDYAVYAAVAGLIVWLVIRRVRRRRQASTPA
ncbi:MAG: DedA family protein [Homoserinimonas sp.]|nr:DedA family protein [Homoserinimonas sp.]